MTRISVCSIGLLAVLALAFVAGGCGDDDKKNPIAPNETVKSVRMESYWWLNLETGAIDTAFLSDPSTDFFVGYNDTRAVHAVVSQRSGTHVAHSPNRTFTSVPAHYTTGATISANVVETSFDAGRVVLIRTNAGAIFKLVYPVEFTVGITLNNAKLSGSP